MALQYSPKIVQESLVMCLDASNNKSYPTDLPVKNGLALWLDAADDTTFSYSSGTSVSQWRDKSGNNRHFFQATAGNQPSRSAVINSRKAIQFTAASSQYLRYNSTIINNTTGGSVFVVWRTAGETQAYSSILDNYHCGANALGAGFQIERSAASNAYYWGFQSTGCSNAGRIVSFPVSYSDNITYIYSISKDSSNVTAFSNGASVTLESSPSATWVEDTKGWTIGCWGNGAETFGRFYNGQHCEVIIFNRGLSPTEVKQVHTYLGQKWSISNTDRSIVDLAGNDDNGLFGNGTVANMPDYDFYNKGALTFNGTSDYTYQSLFANVITNTLTFDVWVKFSDTGSSGRYIMSLGRDIGGPSGGIALLAYGFSSVNSGQITFEFGSGYGRVSSGIVPTTGIWYNLTVTTDGTNTRFYVNGVLANTSSQTTGAVASSPGLSIGSYLNSATPPIPGTYFFNGNIGSVKIYNKALSAAEVLQNYEAQKSKFANTIVQQGLVLNLDAGNPYSYAGSGATWIDVSGAVNDFAAVGSPTYSTNEFILNGTTQYFSLFTAASGFFINNTNNFYADVGYAWSVSVWFKFPVSPTSVRDATINAGNCSYCMFGNSGGIGGGETLSLFVSGISGTTAGVHPYYCMMGLRGAKTQLSIDPVNTNVWNNVVVTWNGSAGRGYFNGVDRGDLNNNVGAGLQVSGYTIGTTGGGATGHLFEGSIAQTFVYNRAISASEVLQNYNALKGRFGL